MQAVIVDEAAQAVELTCLIPLRHRCPRLVLIGDPMQLPATVISPHASRFGYDRSLFERLTRAGKLTAAFHFCWWIGTDCFNVYVQCVSDNVYYLVYNT